MSGIVIKGWGHFLTLIFALFGLLLVALPFYHLCSDKRLREAENSLERDIVVIYKECECAKHKECEWDNFIKALIWVESEDNCEAVGKLDDVGVLQIRKVIVDDCNRILGYDKFSYEDRKDSLKSVEMFNIIQGYYNPEKDMHFALKLWNSKAPVSYHKKVFKKIGEINQQLLQE